ncbi:uncharacterized protein ASCRUDRAFT_113131 [Ascoidea rubescens DSM 1968]|uniref:Uncharacterized protein n=1 Tax=Ascoidea rubescens DSM 1968 TaxID=1344418 RepID=A0A1D2VCB9_9ASCO|nr:hypothetical protein ASCRUDRAFT_113131 [Ascoidea rubescens DSM 1968]ODV59123.1 hypothetical protein ASCRUDRAFT_113131 [Ascoidea rubescens DSM 1968]
MRELLKEYKKNFLFFNLLFNELFIYSIIKRVIPDAVALLILRFLSIIFFPIIAIFQIFCKRKPAVSSVFEYNDLLISEINQETNPIGNEQIVNTLRKMISNWCVIEIDFNDLHELSISLNRISDYLFGVPAIVVVSEAIKKFAKKNPTALPKTFLQKAKKFKQIITKNHIFI